MAKTPLHNQSRQELTTALAAERGKLAQLRQDLYGKRLSNTSQISQVRKEIARILTVLNKTA